MSKMFKEELYPIVKKGLSVKTAETDIIRAVSDYVSHNSKHLVTQGPSTRPTFNDSDKEKLYKAANVSKEEVVAILKKNPLIKGQWRIMNDPFNSVAAMSVRYASLEGHEKLLKSLLLYLTLSMYPSLHFKYFRFEPNEQVMSYTISNMSNKFKIKQVSTLLEALIQTTEKCFELQKKSVDNGNDKEIVDFIMDVKTRLNSLIKNIASEFYKNKEEGFYLNSDGDSYEEDNYYEADSNSYAVERITNKVTLALTVNGPDMGHVRLAANMCQVSVSELRNYVNTLMVSENKDDVRKIIESILSDYLITSQGDSDTVSRNNRFMAHAIAAYKKSNTSDPNIIKIKEVLDKWIDEVDIYKKTQRQATINNFRRALFLFVVISIMSHA